MQSTDRGDERLVCPKSIREEIAYIFTREEVEHLRKSKKKFCEFFYPSHTQQTDTQVDISKQKPSRSMIHQVEAVSHQSFVNHMKSNQD